MIDHSRIKAIVYSIYFSFFLIFSRIFYWQVIKSNDLKRQLVLQQYKTEKILSQNGKVYDVFSNQITYNQPQYFLSLYKPNLKDIDSVVKKVQEINPQLTESDINSLEKFKTQDSTKWITLATPFTLDQKQSLSNLSLDFSLRYQTLPYNNDYLASVLTGLQNYYQKELKGKNGYFWAPKDATGQTLLTKKIWINPPVNGHDLIISINPIIQNQVEILLKKGVTEYSADSGSITIMEPQTGKILAMANYVPTPSKLSQNNLIISNLYEPGSIFKPLILAMALDSNSIDLNFSCSSCNQPRLIGEYTITNWDKSVHPDSTIKDIIKNSDNIGMSYIMDRLGQKNFLSYFHLLNLDRRTGIDLSGEVQPLSKKYWPPIDFATASFGQGFALTQIQMLSAFNTLANDGQWVEPYLKLDKISSPPQKIFNISTINSLKETLSYAVKNSPVSQFNHLNKNVCAKSGTAQVALVGGYSEDTTIASYIGFYPCNQPKFSMLVTINNPKTSPWGSSTAAPIWFDLASSLEALL